MKINALFVLLLMLMAPIELLAAEDPELDMKSQQRAPTAFADDKPRPLLHWGVGEGKSYLVPIGDILMFDAALNLFNRQFSGTSDYDSDFSSFRRNLNGSWVYDNDSFSINQFGHPYQGSMYHGFARSAGLGYWEASAYTLLGSAMWELAGETTKPSINDQITTGFGGSFLGEPLFRLASLLLESGDGGAPGFWRELGAAAISPSTGLNRLVYGKRFDGVFRSNDPAVYTRMAVGMNFNSSVHSNVNTNQAADETPTPQSYDTGEAIADFTVGYGLPGKPGYTYTRPFDYFHFQFTAASSNVFENVMTRGLLFGTDYAVGDYYRGIWGLYGSYDYIAPQIFRISTAAASLGTTGQWWLSDTVALQGSALGGLGYGSAGTIRQVGLRDYHHGVTPQGLLAMRLIFRNRVSLDMTARQYYVTSSQSDESGGEENIFRADVALTVRVYNLHGIALKYVASRRDARYDGLPDTHQSVGAISIGYAYLGQTRSGTVDWRTKAEGGP
ncbi:DUF3943 domain-containing protein [Sinimarinibacterium sp. CAU 1509]|uniref:DUF3943 domain-containing protein n=1 Tax=Sinimarinibacterium sp. CAU 1509 TaxID=2562283 RepID=UPI0010AC5744|nr:DUF3943 domain-containing protein [Sinimarinibacterium sp. CAU 1509]TJY61021.1 DUF3943 domain-containing protein [Sinimarinibacterium sp. CAU 1509]